MLSDDMIQLLTAYVDGELTPRQREEVMRMLNKSAEAREVLRQLQENAHKLKQLPKRNVEPSLVEDILAAIAEEKARTRPYSPPKRRRSILPYFVVAMAASFIVFAIGLLYWQTINGIDNPKKDVPPVVQHDKKQEQKQGPEQPNVPTPRPVNPLIAQLSGAAAVGFGSPLPPPREFNSSFAELQKGRKGEAQFVHEVNMEKSVQLEVVVKKNSDAMVRLRQVLKGQDIKLVADPAAYKPIDDKKVEYLVYAENLTTRELAMLMNELGAGYTVPTPDGKNQKNVASPYQKLKLTAFEDEEKEKFAKMLGVDPKSLQRKEGKEEQKVERTVVLLPGANNGKQSLEVRQFVD